MQSYDKRLTHTFSVAFWADANQKTPLVPRSEEYPQFTLTGPGGTILHSGTLQRAPNGTQWEFSWTPESSAAVSDDYRVEYLMVTKDGRQVTKSESFALHDVEIGLENRDQRLLSFFGQPVMTQLVFDRPQFSVACTALDSGDEAKEGPLTAEHLQQDSLHLYRVSFSGASFPMDSTNLLLWTIQESAASIPTFVYQILDTVGSNTILQMDSVRLLVDKFHKVKGSYQEIKDYELVEALRRGAEIINTFPPYTNWPYNFFYFLPALVSTHIAASAWWLLNSQFMLETDLEFDFTGQSVQLRYDRKGGISEELGRLWDFIENQLRAKVAVMRKMSGVGHLSTRPPTFRHLTRGYIMSSGRAPLGGINRSNQALLLSLFAGNR